MPCEGRSREGELVACKFESRLADGGPLRDRRHVDIGQQAHFAVLVQPFVERSSGVDRRCEGHQIVGGADALGRRDVASVFGVGHLVLIARLDQADVVHVVGFVDLHHHVVAAVVRSHAASGGVVVQFRAVVDVGHERSAVGRQVGDHVAVVGRIDDLAVGGVGQTDEPSGVGLGIGGNDVAVVRAAIDRRRGAEDTGDVAQASAARFAVGVQHVAVVLAFGDDRKGVRCGHDARSAACRDGHVAVVRTACDEVSESRCARGVRDARDTAHLRRGEPVGVAGDLPEQTAFAVVGLDRAPCGVVQPFVVDGPESLFIDRHHGGVAAYGNPFAVFVQQRRSLSVGRHRPVVETAFRIGLHAQQRNVEHLVNGGQHDALLLVLVVLVGDDAVAFGILRHRGDDVARGQLAQVGELLVERCDAALEPGDPLLETVDAAAEFRIVVVAATCREGDGGQKQEI